MSLVVKKFGGSSVATPEKILAIANRILAERKSNDKIVVIVSAMGKTTDNLIILASSIDEEPYKAKYAREMDMLLTTGEQISISLLTMAFWKLGQPAISMTGQMIGMLTNSMHTRGKILDINPRRVYEELNKGKIVVVAGFQGVDKFGDPVTLGRGGSDTSAVALAGALKADSCEIYTDVDGIYSADPRVVKQAHKMQEISYTEMLEMSRLGAKIMQPISVEVGQQFGIPIHVRSTFTNHSGTIIREDYTSMEKDFKVRGVAHDTKVAKISVLGVPDTPGIAHKIFKALADASIDVDMIVQSIRNIENDINDIVFTVSLEDLSEAQKIVELISPKINASSVLIEKNMAKVSIVGAGMLGEPGIAARMFGALARVNVNIDIISTSEISISCLVKSSQINEAVNSIHEEFFPEGGSKDGSYTLKR